MGSSSFSTKVRTQGVRHVDQPFDTAVKGRRGHYPLALSALAALIHSRPMAERAHPPSPARLRSARARGYVPLSNGLVSAAVLAAAGLCLLTCARVVTTA